MSNNDYELMKKERDISLRFIENLCKMLLETTDNKGMCTMTVRENKIRDLLKELPRR